MHSFFRYYILLHRSRKTEIKKCLVVKKSCHIAGAMIAEYSITDKK